MVLSVPANIVTNYLADPGVSSGTPAAAAGISNTVTIPSGATITAIVYSTNPNTAASGTATQYTLTVVDNLPAITSQPANANASCPAGNATFSVTGSGLSLTYQWQVSTNGGVTWTNLTNTAPYSGVTTATLTLTGATGTISGYQYRAIVNGSGICGAGTAATSNAATLSVGLPTPTVTPTSVNVCQGGAAQPISITTPAGFGTPVTVSFPSGPLSLAIPENVSGISNTVNVTGIPTGAVITAASVTLNITHTYVGDCMISLKAPNNNILNLDNLLSGTNNPGANFANTVIGSNRCYFT